MGYRSFQVLRPQAHHRAKLPAKTAVRSFPPCLCAARHPTHTGAMQPGVLADFLTPYSSLAQAGAIALSRFLAVAQSWCRGLGDCGRPLRSTPHGLPVRRCHLCAIGFSVNR